MSVEFELLDISTKEVLFSSTNVQDVNAHAQQYKREGRKVRLQKKEAVVDPTVWHQRERDRMTSGHYKALPKTWITAPWFEKKGTETEFHFAHVSENGENVAYTPNNEYGLNVKHLILSPSRYLAKFYSNVLRSEEISRLANAFTADMYSLEIHNTPEAFRKAYEQRYLKNPSSGADSCMGYPADHFGFRQHPAEAYAAGDLAIACVVDPRDSNTILARAVIWPEKKAANRCYGTDERMRDILLNKLKELGYSQQVSFSGAKMAAIELKEHRGRPFSKNAGQLTFLMPYVDGECSCVKWAANDEHFLLASPHHNRDGSLFGAQSTSGYIVTPRRLRPGEFRCDRCSDIGTEPNAVHVQGHTRTQNWCNGCVTGNAFRCEITNTIRSGYPVDDVLISVTPERRVRGWIDSQHVAECYRTGEFFDVRVFGPLVHITTAEGEHMYICSAFRREDDKDYAPVTARATVARRLEGARPDWVAMDEYVTSDYALIRNRTTRW